MFKIGNLEGKVLTFASLEQLAAGTGVTLEQSDVDFLNKAARNGDIVFFAVNPFDKEMGSSETNPRIGALLDNSLENLNKRFYARLDDI